DYFAKIPVPSINQVRSIEDLMPVIELYHHTVRAGQHDEAYKLFNVQLVYLLYYRFGDYQTCAELSIALFPDGEDQLPRLKDKASQAWMLNTLAISYQSLGKLRRALSLLSRYIFISEEQGDKSEQATVSVNIDLDHITLGL